MVFLLTPPYLTEIKILFFFCSMCANWILELSLLPCPQVLAVSFWQSKLLSIIKFYYEQLFLTCICLGFCCDLSNVIKSELSIFESFLTVRQYLQGNTILHVYQTAYQITSGIQKKTWHSWKHNGWNKSIYWTQITLSKT